MQHQAWRRLRRHENQTFALASYVYIDAFQPTWVQWKLEIFVGMLTRLSESFPNSLKFDNNCTFCILCWMLWTISVNEQKLKVITKFLRRSRLLFENIRQQFHQCGVVLGKMHAKVKLLWCNYNFDKSATRETECRCFVCSLFITLKLCKKV